MAIEIIEQCSDQFPMVLLPVRIETKFRRSDSGTELRIRFYPDTISVAPSPAALTDAERTLGRDYWKARVAARQAPADTELQRAYQGSWNALATRAGAYRAGFIVRTTTPSNPEATPWNLIFPSPVPVPGSPMPQAGGLPDRFRVVAYFRDPTTRIQSEVARVDGAAIPSDLVLGPDPTQAVAGLGRNTATGQLTVPDTLRWLVDFDAAVQVGMAVRLPVAPPFDLRGFDRIIAVGVRATTPATRGSAILEDLFTKHRDSDGFAVVPAGTPTNNTETASSGWQPGSAQLQELFAIEDHPPELIPVDGPLGVKDGWRLVDLFGLSEELVRRAPGAAATDIAQALAFNRAAAPGTVGDFVREYLKGLVDVPTADAFHDFFTTWVTGRGFYPAIRVGRQPYGIVLTSAWNDWKAPTVAIPQPPGIGPRVRALAATHRPRWELLADRVPQAAHPTPDPFQRLLGILGLLASSTDFVSRKAVSDHYIHQRLAFAGAQAPATQAWLNALGQVRGADLQAIDFPPVPGPNDPLLAFLVFLQQVDEWQLPLIDGDPGKALSETAGITPYDGTSNYLQWFGSASAADLSNQHFLDAAGSSIAAPAALLYVMLRHALLAVLETSSLHLAQSQGHAVFDVADRDPLIGNIGAQQNAVRKDYLKLDAARLGLSSKPVALVDWVLEQGRQPAGPTLPPVQRTREVHEALGALADLSTAGLERLLAEHVDLCSYRLDAWITGLYAQRLAFIRQHSDVRGLYVGAYGWVENVRPATGSLLSVPSDSLPSGLRSGANSSVFEDPTNAGYIHAPSIMQAATAAVLRNGYLSHANSSQPLPFGVNLSSARMRAALGLMDGVRNGQPLAALLGYQFERGLHEGHPGLELDALIYRFRDRFPLLAGRLSELPANTSAEVVEARNVVDGLALVQAASSQAYPYGMAGLPALPSPKAAAIVAQVDRLKDSLDSVSDLLLAESVHQVVQGNTARLQGSLQALTSPEAPPEPEVLRTPRGGRLLTFRMGLALNLDETDGWRRSLSPRAQANAPLNHWLKSLLPDAATIQWTVQAPGQAPIVQSLDGSKLEPLDLVLMSGDRLGDQSSELERYLVRQFRRTRGIPDSVPIAAAPSSQAPDSAQTLNFQWNAASPGARTLASVQPLLMRWRRLITQGRPMHAGDWRRSNTAQAADAEDPTGCATGNPRLLKFADLTGRLDSALQALTLATNLLVSALDALTASAAQIDQDPAIFHDPGFRAQVDALLDALFAIELFGIPEATPSGSSPLTAELVGNLLSQAKAVTLIAASRTDQATKLRQTTFPGPLPTAEPARTAELARRNDVWRRSFIEAAKQLFGPVYVIVPLYRLPSDQVAEIQDAASHSPVLDPAVVEEWIHSTSRVRPRVADLLVGGATARWLRRPLDDPTVVQLPHRVGQPWIGGQLENTLPAGDWLSLALWNASLLARPVQAGLLIDDWTETVPAKAETTGVAFHYNRPNAIAPQALLVAIPSRQLGHWSWDELTGSVNEALDLAKIRAVEPDALIGKGSDGRPPEGAYFQALPAILTEMTRTRFASVDFANIVTNVVQANI